MEFDDLETAIHTKCKPVSVTLAVEHKTRRILGFRVADMPAKGKLVQMRRPRQRLALCEERGSNKLSDRGLISNINDVREGINNIRDQFENVTGAYKI